MKLFTCHVLIDGFEKEEDKKRLVVFLCAECMGASLRIEYWLSKLLSMSRFCSWIDSFLNQFCIKDSETKEVALLNT